MILNLEIVQYTQTHFDKFIYKQRVKLFALYDHQEHIHLRKHGVFLL